MQGTWPEVSVRTLYNVRSELLGTLRYTPIGEDLGQGIRVRSNGRDAVDKQGLERVSGYWVLFCTTVMCPRGLTISADGKGSRSSVAQVLGVDDRVLAAALESLWQPDLYTVSRESDGLVRVRLIPGVTPESVLRRWIAKG